MKPCFSFKKICQLFIVFTSIIPLAAAYADSQHATHQTSKIKSITSPSKSFWSVHVGLGGGHYSSGTDGDTFAVTPIETDSLSETSKTTNVFFNLGLQHITPINKNWISAVGIGPELYYQPGSFDGEVNQFQLPALNNYFYTYKVKPWNVYVEGDVYFKPLFANHVTPYVFLGGGESFVRLSYGEVVTPAASDLGVPADSALVERSASDELFSYELGAGVMINISQHYFIGARYVYQHSGHAELSGPGVLSPLKVNLNSHNGYVVIGYQFT